MITPTVLEEVSAWIQSPSNFQITGSGPVSALEAKIANYYGKKYAICISSGTMGLWAVLRAKGIENRIVAGPAMTWGGTFSGALLLRNKVHLLPSSDMGFNISPEDMELLARQGKIKAVIGVDLGGFPHDMQAIRTICDRYNIFYLADAAQSLGAYRNEKPASALADAIVVSFGARKTLSAGEGAAIITDDRILFERIVEQSQHPFRQQKEIGFFTKNECAMNLRIHPLAAIIANASFEESIMAIQQRAAIIERGLHKLVGRHIIYPLYNDKVKPTWYRILCKPKFSGRKKTFTNHLEQLAPGWKFETMEWPSTFDFNSPKNYQKRFIHSSNANNSGYSRKILQIFPMI